MASKLGFIRAQVQVPDTCALCDNTDTVHWFCNDCQESLCNRCKDGHKRGRKTRNDDVVPIKEANKQGEAVIPEVCKIHPGIACDLYCSDCDVIMCSMCFTQKHKQHTFKHIQEEIDSQKKYMQEQLGTLKSKLGQCNGELSKCKQVSQSFNDNVDDIKREIQSQRSKLKAEVDAIADSVMAELSSLAEEELKSHERDCQLHQKKILEIKQLIRDVEQETEHTTEVSSLLKLTGRLRTTIPLYDGTVATESVLRRIPCFVSGQLNQLQLKSMLGYVQVEKKDINSTHVQQISTFRVQQQTQINSICPIDDKQAWMSIYNSKRLILVNQEGTVTERVQLDFAPYCLTLTNTAELLMTRYNEASLLYKLAKDRQLTTFADISPLLAWGISVSDIGEVVVSTDSPTILVLNRSGDRVRQLSCGLNGQSIVGLSTGHVAITTASIGECKELVIKDQSDQTLYTWRGELDNGQKVSGLNLCRIGRDMYNRVFVPDYSNNQVYVISGDDQKAVCLLDKKHRITKPVAVCVDRCRHVWIGCKDGTVHVMQL